MKNASGFAGLALLGIAGYLLLKKTQTIGASGLTPTQAQQAVNTDTNIPPMVAQDILKAPNAAAALAIGNSYLDVPKSGAFAAVQEVQSLPSYNAGTNPFNGNGGSYPRMQGGVFVQNPNQMEVLRIAWDNAHAGFTH